MNEFKDKEIQAEHFMFAFFMFDYRERPDTKVKHHLVGRKQG